MGEAVSVFLLDDPEFLVAEKFEGFVSAQCFRHTYDK